MTQNWGKPSIRSETITFHQLNLAHSRTLSIPCCIMTGGQLPCVVSQRTPILFISKVQWRANFRITSSLFLKASLDAHPFIWKWDFIHLQVNLISIWIFVPQTSLWYTGLGATRKWAIYSVEVLVFLWKKEILENPEDRDEKQNNLNPEITHRPRLEPGQNGSIGSSHFIMNVSLDTTTVLYLL